MDKMNEVSPPGWHGTVAAMKLKHPEISNPWALSYWMRNRGYTPHYKDVETSKVKKVPPKKKERKKKKEKEEKKERKTFKEFLEAKNWKF